MGVLGIIDGCPGEICWLYWRYLLGVLEILLGVMKIFHGFS